MSMQGIKPLISVLMITYKQEAFIAEAIEGVLMQEVDFEVELIIADDCSHDGTQDIVNHYIENHPKGHWIKYHRHEKNIGMMPNFIFALKEVKGKYIALCEGDDYWIDPFKLQKQFDFLEQNEEYNIVFHKVKILNFDGSFIEDDLLDDKIRDLDLEDVIKGNRMHTPSIFFRNVISEYPKWYYNAMPGDHPLQIMLLQNKKKAYNLEGIMAVYRKHIGGVWSKDNGKEFLVERAITKININNFIGIEAIETRLIPFYMLADHIHDFGYKKLSFFEYYKLLFLYLPFRTFIKKKYFYLYHPRLIKYLKK